MLLVLPSQSKDNAAFSRTAVEQLRVNELREITHKQMKWIAQNRSVSLVLQKTGPTVTPVLPDIAQQISQERYLPRRGHSCVQISYAILLQDGLWRLRQHPTGSQIS